MRDLQLKLQKYELTKTEVLSLINLGIGLQVSQSQDATAEQVNGEVNGDATTNGDGIKHEEGENEEEEAEEGAESGLNQLLFSLVVEEADERFAGEVGDAQIDEILRVRL